MEKPTELEEARRVYECFIEHSKKNSVPTKIHDKLMILAKLIFKEPYDPSNYPALDSDEIKQLELIGKDYKLELFMSVAKCVVGKEDSDYIAHRQGYFKRDSFWSSWSLCYITYTEQILTIAKKKGKEEIQFLRMRISKDVIASGSKFIFNIQSPGSKYRIGFDDRKIASQFRNKFKSLIQKRNKRYKSDLNGEPERTERECSNMVSQQGSDSDKEFLEEFDVENIENQTNYKVIQNTDNGRIMVHKQVKNRFKFYLLVECVDPYLALESYIKSEEWNPEVSCSKIINRAQQNCYIVYQSYKSTGYLTRPRDFVLLKLALKKKNRYVLLEKSVSHPQYPPYNMSVRGCINRKVTAFIPHPTNSKLLLIITQLDVDFGGYSTADTNRSLAIKLLESYQKLSSYLIQKSFSSLSQKLFDFHKKHHFNKVLFQSIKLDQYLDSKPLEVQTKTSLLEQFKAVIPKSQHTPITDTYIQLIRANVHWYFNIKNHYSTGTVQGKSLRHIKNQTEDSILCGQWKFHEDGEVQFINQKAIEAQKDIIKYILKQIGSNLFKGKSIMNMSLPVDIFDNKSVLERSARSFGYAPILLSQAGTSTDEVQQTRLATVFILSMSILEMKLQKPFNPIIGQTFQGYLGGVPVYFQQISHHPPISSFLMKGQNFEFYGNLDVKVDMGLNTVVGCALGLAHIVFKSTNLHLECSRPGVQISGISFGARKLKAINKIALISTERRLYSEVSYGKDKRDVYMSKTKMKPNQIIGGVFRISGEAAKRLHAQIKKDWKFSGVAPKQVVQKLSEISGSWNGSIQVNGQPIIKMYDPMPFELVYEDFPLASDSNYRQDLLFRRAGNLAESQISKEKFQNFQRNDRKLRASKH